MFGLWTPKERKKTRPTPAATPKPTKKLWGMTAESERNYLLEYAQKDYTATGEVVDLGSWMGSLTASLLEGLAQNERWVKSGKGVHAYDMFIWWEWMESHYDKDYFARRPQLGESFLPDFLRQVGPFDRYGKLVIHAGDAVQAGWNGRPIEMLVVDIMKSWDLANCVLRDFYPHLIPGVSQIFHQDFIHYYTPWIHLTHYRLREYFELVEDVQHSSTLVFRLKKKIPAELLSKTYSFSDFDDEEVHAAFECSRSLISLGESWRKAEMAAVEAMVWVHQKDVMRAQQAIDRALSHGIEMSHGLKLASEMLNKLK